jgi:hypothetical protein
LDVTNSTFVVYITIQNWSPDNSGTLLDNLARVGFTVQPVNPMVMFVGGQMGPNVKKGTTTSLAIDNQNRRVVLTVSNELTDPSRNIQEVLNALSATGFANFSLERIDVTGSITIAVNSGSSTYVSEIVDDTFVANVTSVFGREVKPVGIRIASAEPLSGGPSHSPFFILIEPLATDGSDTKFLVQVAYSSSEVTNSISFMQSLYEKIKMTVGHIKQEQAQQA